LFEGFQAIRRHQQIHVLCHAHKSMRGQRQTAHQRVRNFFIVQMTRQVSQRRENIAVCHVVVTRLLQKQQIIVLQTRFIGGHGKSIVTLFVFLKVKRSDSHL